MQGMSHASLDTQLHEGMLDHNSIILYALAIYLHLKKDWIA